MFSIINKKKKGFTLVELLIAMAIFMVVITISLGSIISILDAGRKARSLKSVMTNLNFTFEVLSRELKFGRNYHCGVTTDTVWTPQNCTGSGVEPESAITFMATDNKPTIYRLNPVNGTQLEKSTNYGASYIPITSPDIIIQDLKFFVFGAGTGDNAQPRVLVIIRGYAGTKPTVQSHFVLQTTISQRSVDQLVSALPAVTYPPTDSSYTFCANENGVCTFSGTATVGYGADTSFSYEYNVVDSISCDNATFGDPIVGTVKGCYYKIN